MFNHLLGVEVWGEMAVRLVARMGIGHVPGENALEPCGFHGFQAHRLSPQADLGVKTNEDQMGKMVLLEKGITPRLCVWHQISLPYPQSGVHPAPAIIPRTPLPATGAPAGVWH